MKNALFALLVSVSCFAFQPEGRPMNRWEWFISMHMRLTALVNLPGHKSSCLCVNTDSAKSC